MRDPHTDARSDRELVAAANGGEVAAFEALYFRYRDWVTGLAYRFTNSHADSLDVLQETFTYLLQKLPRLELSAKMTTFLYPVVKNLSIRARRRRERHAPGDEALATAPAAPTEESLERSREELRAAVSTLPDAQCEVLLMRFVDDLSLAEIADALEIAVGTVKSRLHHALNALRDDERTRRYFLE